MTDTSLEYADIQAIVRGYSLSWPAATWVYLRITDAADARAFLAAQAVPSSIMVLTGNERAALTVAFSYRGLQRLGLRPEILATFPSEYRLGMASRASDLGDTESSAPDTWDAEWSDGVDLLVGVHAKDPITLAVYATSLVCQALATGSGLEFVGAQGVARILASASAPVYFGNDPKYQPPNGTLLEHFGFNDGVSSPAVRGLDERAVEGNGKFENGAWLPLAAGEFLLGHLDELGELPQAPKSDRLAHNSTYLVYRKLEQHVDTFRRYVQDVARAQGVPAEYVAAKMVGRWRDGENLVDQWHMNAFLYDMDPHGGYCPLGAHIRRANPRDTLGYETKLVNRHRILRRSLTYGRLIDKHHDETENATGQGLVFVALNVDIARQFEFIQQQWLNFGNDLEQGDDRDPIVGNHDKTGKMVIPKDATSGTRPVICGKLPRFVDVRGGEYFFMPGLRAFHGIVSGEFSRG